MVENTLQSKTLLSLPYDILELIASNLHIRHYHTFRLTCKKLYKCLSGHAILQFYYFFTSIPTLKRIYHNCLAPLDPSVYIRVANCNNPYLFVVLCAVGCEKEAIRLLERFSLKDTEMNSCLSIALRFAQALVKRLIAVGRIENANPNQIFHTACYSNDVETARLLINVAGVDPAENECDTFGICCEEGFADIVELFLQDPRVDPSMDDNYALQGAAENGLLNILNMLLADPRVDPTSLDNYAIGAACENGHIGVIRRLLQDPRVDPADDENYAFKNTVGSQIPEDTIIQVLEILVADGRVDPLASDCEVIDRAVSHGQSLVLKYLVSLPGMVVTNAALATSAELGHFECVEFLLSLPYLDPNDNEHPCIIPACRKGQTRVVKLLLLDPRVDPSIRFDYCLRIACHFKHADIVKMLLSHPSVDVTSRDNSAVKYMVRNRWEAIYKSIPPRKLKEFATSNDIFNKSLFDFSSYSDPEFAVEDNNDDGSDSSWESDYSSDSDSDSVEDNEDMEDDLDDDFELSSDGDD